MNAYYVYIMSSKARTLHIGITSNLKRRVTEHQCKLSQGFSDKHNMTQLAYFEDVGTVAAAIAREKQIKGMSSQKKIELIEAKNPEWKDLSFSF